MGAKRARSASTRRATKQCPRCGRDFAWRRKWARVWDQVVYCSERCRRDRGDAQRTRVGQEIEARLGRSSGTICPSEVARALWPDDWRPHMEEVRRVARLLAADERIVWRQSGRRIDPKTARGPVRLGRGPAFAKPG